MKRPVRSERFYLFVYFIGTILAGAVLLWLPYSWKGQGRLSPLDALFTATSAVCVTGLVTVDTAQHTLFGQLVILLLIQFGGLGIITFSTLLLVRPRLKLSMTHYRVIKGFSLDSIESDPLSIVRQIVGSTLAIEALGAVALYFGFRATVPARRLFSAVFHSISAFCNAGFSTFSTNLEGYAGNATVSLTVMALIVAGGLGFVVLQDVGDTLILGRKRALSLHSRSVLTTSLILILAGAGLFFLFEHRLAYAALNLPQRVMAAFFQSVTPRTAGFDTVAQSGLTVSSRMLTLLLMLIGGASGSTAGGIKVNTFFIITLLAMRGADERGEVSAFRRKIPTKTVDNAVIFTLKALMLIFLVSFLLTVTERYFALEERRFIDYIFEAFSAFGTVGLSMGVTPGLSVPGKLLIIATMFMGRVGLLALAIPGGRRLPVHMLDYPEEEVMVG
jgi:trk system potassium uptake protein TrkH